MRIKFLTSIAGVNYSHKPGDEVDWPDEAEAARFVAATYAVEVRPTQITPSDGDESSDEKSKGGKGTKADGAAGKAKGGKSSDGDESLDEKSKGGKGTKADGAAGK